MSFVFTFLSVAGFVFVRKLEKSFNAGHESETSAYVGGGNAFFFFCLRANIKQYFVILP